MESWLLHSQTLTNTNCHFFIITECNLQLLLPRHNSKSPVLQNYVVPHIVLRSLRSRRLSFHRHNNLLNLFYSKFSKGSSKENECTMLASANALTSETCFRCNIEPASKAALCANNVITVIRMTNTMKSGVKSHVGDTASLRLPFKPAHT